MYTHVCVYIFKKWKFLKLLTGYSYFITPLQKEINHAVSTDSWRYTLGAECTDLCQAPWLWLWLRPVTHTPTGMETARPLDWLQRFRAVYWVPIKLLGCTSLRYSRIPTGQGDLPTTFIIIENTMALLQENGVISQLVVLYRNYPPLCLLPRCKREAWSQLP